MSAVEFVLGFMLGAGAIGFALCWWLFSPRTDVEIVDVYWTENAERWEWLRNTIRAEHSLPRAGGRRDKETE